MFKESSRLVSKDICKEVDKEYPNYFSKEMPAECAKECLKEFSMKLSDDVSQEHVIKFCKDFIFKLTFRTYLEISFWDLLSNFVSEKQ